MIIKWLSYSAIIYFTCWFLPGISVESFWTAAVTAIILALVNNFVKPFLILITLPVTALTLGFFLFAINALMLMLVSSMIDGFVVAGFWWAMLFSIVLSIISYILHKMFGTK